MIDKKSNEGRRKILKSVLAGSGAVVTGKSLPESWSKPIVDAIMLPAHAETSPITTTTTTPCSQFIGLLDLSANGGINPATGSAWATGDQYRVVFVTSGSRDATSNNIGDYDSFVQSAGSGLDIGGATIRAIASTASVSAISHIPGGGGAVFRVDGSTVVSNSVSAMFGGLSTPISLNENGSSVTGEVWTGSHSSGAQEGSAPPRVLGTSGGNSTSQVGRAEHTGSSWIWNFHRFPGDSNPLYGISDAITITLC